MFKKECRHLGKAALREVALAAPVDLAVVAAASLPVAHQEENLSAVDLAPSPYDQYPVGNLSAVGLAVPASAVVAAAAGLENPSEQIVAVEVAVEEFAVVPVAAALPTHPALRLLLPAVAVVAAVQNLVVVAAVHSLAAAVHSPLAVAGDNLEPVVPHSSDLPGDFDQNAHSICTRHIDDSPLLNSAHRSLENRTTAIHHV